MSVYRLARVSGLGVRVSASLSPTDMVQSEGRTTNVDFSSVVH